MTRPTPDDLPHRAFAAAAAGLSLVVVAVIVWAALDLLLLVFAGILVAQLLFGLSDGLRRGTGLPRGWALAAVCVALAGLLTLGGALLAPAIADQARTLAESLPHSLEAARASVRATRAGAWLGEAIPASDDLTDMLQRALSGTGVVRRVTGLFTSALGALASAVLVGFLGLFLAARPRTYTGGLVRLLRPERRGRAREVLSRIGTTLRWWLLGMALSMTLVGTLSALGLWLLGIPLALTLGLIAALLAFIPNFGPVAAVIPAALVALSKSPTSALYVVLLYLAIQTVESYAITPLVQQRALSLPPALLLATQVVVGGLLGALGLALATPMLAVAVVLIQSLYIEDTLRENAHD